jgi:hypothetical protein
VNYIIQEEYDTEEEALTKEELASFWTEDE